MHLLLDIDWTFFDRKFMDEPVSDYFWFAGIILGTLLLKRPLAALVARISSRLAARFSYLEHRDRIRGLLFKPLERLLQTVLYFIAINKLSNILNRFVIPESFGYSKPIKIKLGDVIDHVFLLLFILFFARVVTRFFDFIFYLSNNKAGEEKNLSRKQLLPLVNEVSKMLVWILAIFCVLGYVFHVNVPALITGLGIGGVAIALAGKETVENFLASFIILSDKPFQVGETIRMGEPDGLGVIEGVVDRIGFRSTRLRHIDGYAVIIPNQKLVSKNIINLSVKNSRNIKILAKIKYKSSQELQALIARLKDGMLNMPMIKEPLEITVENFDSESLQLTISLNLPFPLPASSNLNDIKQEINLKVLDLINQGTD